MKLRRCGGKRFFHRWLYLCEKKVVYPPLGPYDPRPDEDRQTTREHYICVHCGKEELREPDYSGYIC